MATPAFCPSPAELALNRLVISLEGISVAPAAHRSVMDCPLVGFLSRRVHDRDTRILTDLPWRVVSRDAGGRSPNRFRTAACLCSGDQALILLGGTLHVHNAVLAAVPFAWSLGQGGGQMNRLTLLKRTIFGYAGFALFGKCVLRAA